MFTGMFGQRVIRATHPHIVVAGEKVLGSFSTLEAAEAFISKKGGSAALVLRHQGQEWIVAEDRLVEPPRYSAKTGLTRVAQALSRRSVPLISSIEAALQKYPRVTYLAGMHSLEVPAQTRNGFQVWIRQRADRYTVGFEKWHQEFTDAASAFDFFMFGLSRVCRLHVFSCGGVDYKWQVQRRLDCRWYTVSESGLGLSVLVEKNGKTVAERRYQPRLSRFDAVETNPLPHLLNFRFIFGVLTTLVAQTCSLSVSPSIVANRDDFSERGTSCSTAAITTRCG